MKIGFFNESRLDQLHPERRVAVTPQAQTIFAKHDVEWIGESGAGLSAGFKDELYLENKIQLLANKEAVLAEVDIVVHISPDSFPEIANFSKLNYRKVITVGNVDSLWRPSQFQKFGSTNLTSYSLRMPGHMNVLLAEADIPYDRLTEMDDINPEFAQTDVALVIGANDVTNPAAHTDPKSAIYGMPVLNVANARTVIVIKRGMSTGFAGIENELYFMDKTLMLFGDAKSVLTEMIKVLDQK